MEVNLVLASLDEVEIGATVYFVDAENNIVTYTVEDKGINGLCLRHSWSQQVVGVHEIEGEPYVIGGSCGLVR